MSIALNIDGNHRKTKNHFVPLWSGSLALLPNPPSQQCGTYCRMRRASFSVACPTPLVLVMTPTCTPSCPSRPFLVERETDLRGCNSDSRARQHSVEMATGWQSDTETAGRTIGLMPSDLGVALCGVRPTPLLQSQEHCLPQVADCPAKYTRQTLPDSLQLHNASWWKEILCSVLHSQPHCLRARIQPLCPVPCPCGLLPTGEGVFGRLHVAF